MVLVQPAGCRVSVRRAPPWIPSVGADYFLGIDGFSTLLILLTTMMGFIAVLSSWTAITERVKEYYIFLLVLQTGMLGAFMALDFLLFFLFWEVMLVPMYFLIGIWGSANRLYSAIKFFLYTLVGSVVMLLGILALYFQTPATATSSFWLAGGGLASGVRMVRSFTAGGISSLWPRAASRCAFAACKSMICASRRCFSVSRRSRRRTSALPTSIMRLMSPRSVRMPRASNAAARGPR